VTVKKEILLALFLPAVIIGKITRWNFSGNLVENAIGRVYLNEILYGTPSFTLWDFSASSATSDNVVFLYKFLTFFGPNTYNEFEVLITVVFNLLLFALLLRLKDEISLALFIFSLVSIALLNMFSFTLGKEPVQMLLFACLFYILKVGVYKEKRAVLIIVSIVAIFVLFLRAYYVYLIVFFLTMQSVTSLKKELGSARWIIMLALSAFVFFCVLKISAIFAPDVYSTLQYLRSARRVDTHAWNTAIQPFFSSSGVTDISLTLEFIGVVFRLLMPLELITVSTRVSVFLKIMFILYQLFVTVVVFVNMKRFNCLPKEKRTALNLFLAFLMMSAVFEPDFGSFVRHESVCLPILLLIFDTSDTENYTWIGE
jgi:hypothetical protein